MNSLTDQFEELMSVIRKAPRNAKRALNTVTNEMCWDVGKYLSEKRKAGAWGDSTVVEFSKHARVEFRDDEGLSPQNLHRMVQYYEAYAENEFLSTLSREITWSNNRIILTAVKTDKEREFYIQLARNSDLSARKLESLIQNDIYRQSLISTEYAQLFLEDGTEAITPDFDNIFDSLNEPELAFINSENRRLCITFLYLNKLVFNNALPIPLITIKEAQKKNHCGGLFVKDNWNKCDKIVSEISIEPDVLSLSFIEVCAVLLHQMIHYFCKLNKINAVTNSGRYHNESFKEQAEKHGLICEYESELGWGITKLNDETEKNVKANLDNKPFELKKNIKGKKTSGKPSAKIKKDHKCPTCNLKCTTNAEAKLLCLKCNVELVSIT